jgi:hypothetical protein
MSPLLWLALVAGLATIAFLGWALCAAAGRADDWRERPWQ